jgi:hypothetical protein
MVSSKSGWAPMGPHLRVEHARRDAARPQLEVDQGERADV